jgi:RNA polymerase sigma factor (sigma-70 family)
LVASVARRILGSSSECDDIVADVFTALWRWPEKFEPDRGSLPCFLRMKTRGRCIDVLRSDINRRRREEAQREGSDMPVRSTPVDALILSDEAADELHRAVASLPVGERTAIDLAYFGGMSYQEVAVHLGLPEGTVKSRIRSGLRRMGEEVTSGSSVRDPGLCTNELPSLPLVGGGIPIADGRAA